MPILIAALREGPQGVYHGNTITEWVQQRMRLPSRNPQNGIATALFRLSKRGLVRAHGDNNWEWVGEGAEAGEQAAVDPAA